MRHQSLLHVRCGIPEQGVIATKMPWATESGGHTLVGHVKGRSGADKEVEGSDA